MASNEGRFAIPSRVFLNQQQRERLNQLLLEQEVDLPDLLTELLVSFLDHLPESPVEAPETPTDETQTELQQRRAELRRLRARLVSHGSNPPRWMVQYIRDLQSEIDRLQGS